MAIPRTQDRNGRFDLPQRGIDYMRCPVFGVKPEKHFVAVPGKTFGEVFLVGAGIDLFVLAYCLVDHLLLQFAHYFLLFG
jgi:hypothetical protein